LRDGGDVWGSWELRGLAPGVGALADWWLRVVAATKNQQQ